MTYERVGVGSVDKIFSLKAGSYRLTATHRSENGEAFGETDVDIQPGERTEAIIVFSNEG